VQGLAGISLLVGGVGIANTMVVAVLECHGEIGLRRALGARTGQVTCQFVLEAVVLAAIGGIGGTAIGTVAVVVLTRWQGVMLRIDPSVLVAGPLIAVVIGALAGLYAALRAARLPPTTALRAG
jgi:putative ABC transport system permease protein